MNFSSKLIEDAVTAFSSLPGIGKKTALRLALHLVSQDREVTETFADSVLKMRQNIKRCKKCHNISDAEVCMICEDPRRDQSFVCVVEGIRDVMAIEETGQFRGVYHILGGVISPIEGIAPQDLEVESLLTRVAEGGIKEIVMAISATIEGDTTVYYLSKRLALHGVQISTLARGIAFGGDLEYADEVTLGRSLMARVPYKVDE